MFQRSLQLLRYISKNEIVPVRCINSTQIVNSVNKSNLEHQSNDEQSGVVKETDLVNDTEDLIQVERYDSITIIGLNRRQKRNAINQPMALKICEAITNFENDDSSPVGVLHGVGGTFSAGYDIDDLQSETLKLEHLVNSEGTVVSTFIRFWVRR